MLEPLYGYLTLGAKLSGNYGDKENRFAQAWNFGPAAVSCRTVGELVAAFIDAYGSGSWEDLSDSQKNAPHEAGILKLSWDKAQHYLGWNPGWDFGETVSRTALWYKKQAEGISARELCFGEINDYCDQ